MSAEVSPSADAASALYYSVAHYYDISSKRKRKKYRNIDNHIKQFLNVENKHKEFILVSAVDTPRGDIHYTNVKEHLTNYCKKIIPNYPVHIIIYYNWGGTIAALWECYKFLQLKNGYIAHFEEDFGPKNNNWYLDSIKLLKDGIMYVGESNLGRIKRENDDGRITFKLHKGQPRLGNPEVWTDGGFYFSSINKLKVIAETISCFHKGNQNTKYLKPRDGISLGEVGFPTLLYHNNLRFTVLNRNIYFVNEWN